MWFGGNAITQFKLKSAVPGVIGLEKCFVPKVGFRYYVDLHVIVDGKISVSEGHGITHRVEDVVLRYDPCVAKALVHVEPDEKKPLLRRFTNEDIARPVESRPEVSK